MSKGKAPAFQFYVRDWLSDPQLRMASHSAKGIWIDLLCFMWEAPERGILTGTEIQLAKMVGATEEDFKLFLEEAVTLKFANVTLSNEKVTLENRRMKREQKTRDNTKLRVQRHRSNAPSNDEVTPPSSSSSSSSIIEQELELPDFIDSDTWKAFKTHRVQIKRRMTLHAEKLIINKLIKFKEAGHDPNAIINLSIENGWISVFEPKREMDSSTTPGKFYKPPEDESDPEKTVTNLKKLRETLNGVGDKRME